MDDQRGVQMESKLPSGPTPAVDTVVVPLDNTGEAEAAVAVAAVVARQARAGLTLLSVRPSYLPAAAARVRLEDAADRLGVDADLVVAEPGDVAAQLAEAGSEPGVLLCLRTHARSALGELTLGSVSEQVVRHCRRPTLLVGPRCVPPPDRFASMVVGLDGSPLAEQILPTVTTWATELGVTPWLCQVLTDRMPFEIGNDVQEIGYLYRVAGELGDHAVQAEWDVAHDHDPAAGIIRFIRQPPHPLVALTTHGRSDLGRLALGSVAFRVARRAPCPVLVLRPSRWPSD
jgi:nucleotide-binding universal stress UspA family protein